MNSNAMRRPRDLLRIEDLHVSFSLMGARITAVRGANLRVLPGKVTALVGESGSGKSVISQTAMGLQPPTARVTGKILFDDPLSDEGPIDILPLPRDGKKIRSIRGGRMGMIFQEPMTSFSPLHTIGDQISESLAIHTGLTVAEMRERCEDMLARVGFNNPRKVYDMYSFELSGGMRQRAMIAMALVCGPALLIADEPTTALDVTIQAQILKLLRDLQQQMDMAVLLVTHDLGVVANIADEVVVIYQGEIMEAGPVETIFHRPAHPYLKGLMAAIPHFGMKRGDRLKPLREIEVNQDSLLSKKYQARTGPDVILSVRDLSKTFVTRKDNWAMPGQQKEKPRPAVDGVSFDIRRGECLGLVGESGCGKTTVSKILMRAIKPDAGSVLFDDGKGPVDVLNAKGAELQSLRTRLQMVFQDPQSSLSPRMTVGDILREPLDIHDYGDAAKRRMASKALIRAIGLDEASLKRYPHSFSGGQRQRIGIARALALGPSMIICDEPVSALDVSVQAQILNLLKDLQKDLGLTYLFISHNLAVVDYMADRVAVMWAGRIVEIAPREIIMTAPVHPYTRALLDAVPFPDLERPLNFETAGRTSAVSRESWAQVFRDEEGSEGLAPADLGGGHFVLARRNADMRELCS
ncbi:MULTISPECIES: ABC transporter ATP-binding protein [unclassified Shinella]|jgi:peptide/nickel transport system ATP-binding protein|uniref:dipeptide ABC transporter ATP-binding protein n=3 Tax=Shinella TaxID=323620 RepID=UPI0003C55451|nr:MULTISPECIES: ABC transporter ATP-binding protein [unclassified Shinella]EYR82945.1 ABC-type transport system ATPase subunit [Shinella sp. DD12]MCO5151528.1 ABC transporter ATP-binding protein [Shinella sp.]MDC7266135.1 ABC transporter ATP-binding protein [Shinella sp. HY16]MDC7273032.1 ABC transporter ATP-binding protein [Shinella sp. YZ44]MDG4673355.1 ABC transporter ATP-binding protein [Shinella sp. 838]